MSSASSSSISSSTSTTSSVPSSTTHSMPPSSAMEQNASVSTTMATVPTGSCPLLHLPDALFSRVLHFLSTHHKLNELSHLCSHFTPLSPIAFHHSHLELDVNTAASRHPSVPHAAFGVHSLTLNLSTSSSGTAASTVLPARTPLLPPPWPAALAPFSALRSLSLQLSCSPSDSNNNNSDNNNSSLLSALVPSAAVFPSLERLTVLLPDFGPCRAERCPNFGLFLSTLSDLPSLHHLTLCLPLHTDDYADIFTLPHIRTINLCNNHLLMARSLLFSLPSLLSPSCHSLTLPRLSDLPDMHEPPDASSPEPDRHFMDSVSRQQVARAADGLQYLAVNGGPQDHALLLAPAFPSLTALRVDNMCLSHETAAVLSALSALSRLQHFDLAIEYKPDMAVWEQFLSQAGPRCKTAHLHGLDSIPSHEITEWIGVLLLHCTGLESLDLASQHLLQNYSTSIGGSPFASHALYAALSSLARLHTLRLCGLQLDNEQVAAVLQHCPLLEDCTLKTPLMSAGMLAALGSSCPLLRRVWLEGQTEELMGEKAAESLLACTQARQVGGAGAPSSSWFTHLRVMYIDWMAGRYSAPSEPFHPRYCHYDPTAAQSAESPLFSVSPRLIALLPSLLAAAPLRYLRLPVTHDSSAQLLLFEWFVQLRGLSAFGRMSAGFEHCTQPNPHLRRQRVGAEVGVEQWWEKASESSRAAERRMAQAWPRLFKGEATGRADSDGRAEYFSLLRKEVECPEEKEMDRVRPAEEKKHREAADDEKRKDGQSRTGVTKASGWSGLGRSMNLCD